MKKLRYYQGNLDGSREGFIAAFSMRDAIETGHINCGVKYFADYWRRQLAPPKDLPHPAPNTLYTRSNNLREEPWVLGRCVLPSR